MHDARRNTVLFSKYCIKLQLQSIDGSFRTSITSLELWF